MFDNLYVMRLLLWLSLPALVTGCGTGKSNQPEGTATRTLTVGGTVIRPRPLENVIKATGTVIAGEEVELRSEVPGRITAIHFEEGSRVARGMLLMKTDDRELQAQLKKMQADEKQAHDEVFRKKKLLELKAVSQEEYDRAVTALDVILAQTELIRAQISKTEIYAPFGGRIGLRQVSPGGFVSSSTLVARLQQTDPVKIDFAIPEKYRAKVKEGAPVRFRTEGNDSTFTGHIYAIEPRIDPATRNVPIRARCPNPDGLLYPGSFAEVEILLDRIADAVVIPSEAVIPVMNGEKVFVCRVGKARSQLIRTGIRTEREVEVTEGLQPGDTIITTGLLQLREAAAVKIRIAS